MKAYKKVTSTNQVTTTTLGESVDFDFIAVYYLSLSF